MCTHTQNQCSPFPPNLKYFLFCPTSFSAYYSLSLITWLNYWSISWITDILQHRTLQQDIPSPPGQSKSSSDSLIAFWIQLQVQGQSKNKLERILEFLPRCCSGGAVEQLFPLCPSHCSATSFLSPLCNLTLSHLPMPRGEEKCFEIPGSSVAVKQLHLGRGERKGYKHLVKNHCPKNLLLQPAHPNAPSNKELQGTLVLIARDYPSYGATAFS